MNAKPYPPGALHLLAVVDPVYIVTGHGAEDYIQRYALSLRSTQEEFAQLERWVMTGQEMDTPPERAYLALPFFRRASEFTWPVAGKSCAVLQLAVPTTSQEVADLCVELIAAGAVQAFAVIDGQLRTYRPQAARRYAA